MPETPSFNDKFNDLLYKLAQNLYENGVANGKTLLVQPKQGWTDYDLLKAAVTNSARLLS
jgi:hypothetical protein